MNYYSQAGQDKWIEELLVKGEGISKGTFLDIGCGKKEYSNTLGLEEIGWTGTLVDNSVEVVEWCLKHRNSPIRLHDATTMNWYFLEGIIDYLSLDVNGGSMNALIMIPIFQVQFRAITIEHDSYRFGEKLREPERSWLSSHGYQLVRPDIEHDGMPFEDWWIKPELCPRLTNISTK